MKTQEARMLLMRFKTVKEYILDRRKDFKKYWAVEMSSWRKPALPTIHNTQPHLLPSESYKVAMQKNLLK